MLDRLQRTTLADGRRFGIVVLTVTVLAALDLTVFHVHFSPNEPIAYVGIEVAVQICALYIGLSLGERFATTSG